MKRNNIFNNPLTRALALAWCALPNRSLARKQRPYAHRLYNPKKGDAILMRPLFDACSLTLARADDGHMCGVRKDSRAFLTSCTFNVMDARTDAELKEFDRLCALFGLHANVYEHANNTTYSRVEESFREGYFWRRDQLPGDVKPILLMSNGSRVRGYWRRNGNAIELYRPNPNCPAVHNPLPWRVARRMGLCYI